LAAIFAVLLVLMATVIGLGLFKMNSLNSAINDLVQQSLRLAARLHQIAIDLPHQRIVTGQRQILFLAGR
jgi:hypothetical protein